MSICKCTSAFTLQFQVRRFERGEWGQFPFKMESIPACETCSPSSSGECPVRREGVGEQFLQPRKSSLLEGKSNVAKNSPDSGDTLCESKSWDYPLRAECLCFGVFRLQNGHISGTYLRRLWVAYIRQYRWGSRIMLDTSWQQLLATMGCPMMSQLLHCLSLSDIY